jgi:hypothetical protein
MIGKWWVNAEWFETRVRDNMKVKGFNSALHPGITMHKIPVPAGFPGLVFTIGMLAVFLMGIPALTCFLVFAAVLGIGFALVLRFIPRQAGLIAFVLTAAVLVCLVGIPGVDDWRRGEELDLKRISTPIIAPPPRSELSAYQCDCRQRQAKQPCGGASKRNPGQKRPRPPSPFDGTWQGEMNNLPVVKLLVADASGGQIGGVVTFFLQMRDDARSRWRVAGKFAAPLLLAHADGKDLVFQLQRHKRNGSPEFGPDVKFRLEPSGANAALLYNLDEPSPGPIKLTRTE